MSNTVMARLRSAVPLLGPSERRVAQVILERTSDVVEWSTSELAEAAGTSAATVSRACQTLGFRGFQHLRLEVARAAPDSEVSDEHPLSQIFADAADAIKVGRASLDTASIDTAVAILASARRLVLVGSGFSAPPLQDAAMRFATVGRPAEAPIDVLAQQFAVNTLRPGDVCLTVSYSGANANTLHACRAAKERCAQSPLTHIADVKLVTGQVTHSHNIDPFLSRLSHLLVLHTLHSALESRASHDDTASMREVVAEALARDA